MKKGRGQNWKSNDRKGNDRKGDDWKSQDTCHGCGIKGHIKAKCRSKHKWASDEKSKSDANMATSTSTSESESFLFSVIHMDPVSIIPSEPVSDSTPDSAITVDVASANQSADYWILDTGATNHVTGNRHLFATFHPMAKREHQVKATNNCCVDAEGSGTITLYVDKPNAKPAKIVLQHVLYVPACGTTNLLSIILLMENGVYFDFKLNGATASLGSVLVYEAPLINSLFVLKRFSTSESISRESVAIHDASSSIPGISGGYSNIRPAVDNKDILVWHAFPGHLSWPAIKRLPNAVRGIQLHAESPSTCTCEACIMGKMFWKPFQPSEDKAMTRLLELIHSDVIRPMQTQTLRGYRYINMFTNAHSRYTEVYCMKAKSEAPAKYKEYVAKVEKQHPKSKVCRIRVDSGGEYATREKFLEYLAEKGIIREVSAPYSRQQNGFSERCDRTVPDPARPMLMHAGMPNML